MIKEIVRGFMKMVGLTKPHDATQQTRSLPPGHYEAVEEHLRRTGMRIENQRSPFPTFRPDQFGADIGATERHRHGDDHQSGPGWLQ